MGFLILAPFLALAEAFVFATLWGWFVTPVTGNPAPSLPICYGLVLLAGWLTTEPDPNDERDPIEKAVFSVVRMGVVLAFGWIAQALA